MPRIQPLLPLLRPLAAPHRAASQQLFRFSTVHRLRVDEPISKPKNTPSPAKFAPQPATGASKTPETSPQAPSSARAADTAAIEAATEADSAQAPAPKPVLPSERLWAEKAKKSSSSKDGASTAASNKPQPSKPTESTGPKQHKRWQIQLPPPRYHVARSSGNNLPIYTDYKRGGNLHLTTIRKITGDLSALRDEMRVFLNKKDEDVKINGLTQHVVIKGFHKKEIADFLTARGM